MKDKAKLVKEMALRHRPGQPFTAFDVYMELMAREKEVTPAGVKQDLDRLAEDLVINPARKLDDGWYRIWNPSDEKDMTELAGLQAQGDLTERHKQVIRDTVRADERRSGRLRKISGNWTITRRALIRRGIINHAGDIIGPLADQLDS